MSCVRVNKDGKGTLPPAGGIGPGPVIGGGVGIGSLTGRTMAVWSSVVVGLGVLFVL